MKEINNARVRNADMNKKRLMTKLREYDFAIKETVLFLDTHPHNKKALKYYTKLRGERQIVVAEYEKNFGPVTEFGNVSESGWDWIKGPWPWEGEC